MNTIQFMQEFVTKNSHMTPCAKLTQLRTELFTKGVCWVDSINGKFNEHETFQVVLFLKRNQLGIDYSNPIITECNGLVLQYADSKWSPLAIPTPNCTQSKISMNKVDSYFQRKRYQIYEVLDATIINVYFHEGAWKIATSRGYDVTHFPLSGDHSYSEAFNSIAAAKYPKFSFNQLDPNYCYTFALRWNEFHCFNETKHIPLAKHNSNDYIKLIKASDLKTLKDLDLTWLNISLPIYHPVDIKNASSLSVLSTYSKNAYAKYAKGYETNNFKFKPLYGYILRATGSNIKCEYQNIMLTSSLYNLIKQGLYNKASASLNEMIVHMFVQQRRKEQFKVIFDQYKPTFDKLEGLVLTIGQVVDKLITDQDYQPENPMIHAVAVKVADQIWKHNSLKNSAKPSAVTQSLVYDCMHSNDYVSDLITLIELQ